jgi:hypothetical protein
MKRLLLLFVMAAGCEVSTTRDAPTDAAPSMIQPDDENEIPCGPRRVLQTVCQHCHRNPPINGAPFPLVRYSDIVRQTPDGEIRVRMIEQLEVGRMPMAPVTIDYLSRETLLDWLHAGAPREAPHECLPDAGPTEN